MSTTTETRTVIEPETPQGWPALFAALPPDEPTLYYSLISPEQINDAQSHIREAMKLMRRLSQSLNARALDDDFDRPNDADIAIEELSLALEKLA